MVSLTNKQPMHIRIINADICETCENRTCAFVDARIKDQFYSIRTETTVCPLGILIDETKPTSFGSKCINCALCVKSCFATNLEIVNYSPDFDIANLLELQYNAIALSYLDKITGFAANTNRNRSLNFDGFLQTKTGESCFVEVDYNNDSLECCRRLIGAFITYEGHIGSIRNGLIVLQDFPKEGSREVFNVIEKLASFPSTKDYQIYFCTFSLLRHMMLKLNTTNLALSDLFYNPRNESIEEYKQRMIVGRITDSTSLPVQGEQEEKIFKIFDDIKESEKFVNFLPVYSYKAACGMFRNGEIVEPVGWIRVDGHGKLNTEMFVMQAKGKSMETRIHDGDYCVFEKYKAGTRNGEIVLCQHHNYYDADSGGAYSIKVYSSEKQNNEDGVLCMSKVVLTPLNKNYETIVIDAKSEDTEEFKIIAIYKGNLS